MIANYFDNQVLSVCVVVVVVVVSKLPTFYSGFNNHRDNDQFSNTLHNSNLYFCLISHLHLKMHQETVHQGSAISINHDQLKSENIWHICLMTIIKIVEHISAST